MISYETSHPVVFRADQPFESLVVRVPRQLLGRAGDADQQADGGGDLRARGAAEGGGRVRPRAGRTGWRTATITPADAPNAVDCVLDLDPGRVRGAGRSAASRRGCASRAEILLNVQSFIEANLGDPHLDPEEIARASFISTRYLHKLFEAEGTSVCRWIRASRLERCRRDLLDPALADETILAIASRWGLPGPAALQPPVPVGVRLLAERAPARGEALGGARSRRLTPTPAGRPMTPVLKATGISVSFGGVHAVVDVDLEVGEGQLVGPDRPERRRQDDLHRRDQRLRPLRRAASSSTATT